jgi:uncharacterized membrane protein
MNDESGLSKNRVETLTDGIFAVAMTLLVLNINVPNISSHSTSIIETELAKRLFDLWPKVLSYVISFVILAIYWRAPSQTVSLYQTYRRCSDLDKCHVFDGNLSFTFFDASNRAIHRTTTLNFCI